jgi:hypothetical protein
MEKMVSLLSRAMGVGWSCARQRDVARPRRAVSNDALKLKLRKNLRLIRYGAGKK